LPGSDERVQWPQATDAITVKMPGKIPNEIAIVFKIVL
jgi:hypothetical protein